MHFFKTWQKSKVPKSATNKYVLVSIQVFLITTISTRNKLQR